MADNLKLFLGWSGDYSKQVAQAFRDWIPLLFDTVTPFMSDHDIAAGQRGMSAIEGEVEGTQFGIILVTQENQGAPWLNFETGALSKTITTDREQRVAPLLVDIGSPSQLTGPLTQFQAKKLDKEGVTATMISVAALADIRREVIEDRVNRYWNELEEAVKAAKPAIRLATKKPQRPAENMLDELLGLVRAMRKDFSGRPVRLQSWDSAVTASDKVAEEGRITASVQKVMKAFPTTLIEALAVERHDHDRWVLKVELGGATNETDRHNIETVKQSLPTNVGVQFYP